MGETDSDGPVRVNEPVEVRYAPHATENGGWWTPARVGGVGIALAVPVVFWFGSLGGDAKSDFWMSVWSGLIIGYCVLIVFVITWAVRRALARRSTGELMAPLLVASVLTYWTWYMLMNQIQAWKEIAVVRHLAAIHAAQIAAGPRGTPTTAPATGVAPATMPQSW